MNRYKSEVLKNKQFYFSPISNYLDFPGGSVVKNLPAKERDMGLIPGLGRPHGEGHGNTPQYSCLKKNTMDRGAWQANSPWDHKSQKNLATKQQQLFKQQYPAV